MNDADLTKLESRIEELIQTCTRLREENRALRHQQATLLAERSGLMERNESAHAKVDAIIQRLRSMERD